MSNVMQTIVGMTIALAIAVTQWKVGVVGATAASAPPSRVICDFERVSDLAGWRPPVVAGGESPVSPVRIETSSEHATSGHRS